jgi:hypothetical protein
LLQLLEPLDGVAISSAILLLPSVIGRHANSDLPCGFFDALASRYNSCGFPQLLDDFLCCVSLAFHGV